MPLADITVGTMPNEMLRGVASLEGPHLTKDGEEFTPAILDTLSMYDALTTVFDTDRFFTCYTVEGLEDTGWPRLRKPALKSFVEAGAPVVMRTMAFDWDTPDHQPWTDKLLEEFLNKFECLEDPHLKAWSCWYTSLHGARVVYELSEPVSVTDGEMYLATMLRKFKDVGLEMDAKCKDWTRLYRCPLVVRNGTATTDCYVSEIRHEQSLDISTLKKTSPKVIPTLRDAYVNAEGRPGCEDIFKYLNKEGASGFNQSDWYKDAKRVLKRVPCFDALFKENVPLARAGERNDAVMKALGACIPIMLRKVAYTTPEHMYALFYGPVTAFEMDRDWLDHLWNAITTIWPLEVGKLNEEREEIAEKENQGLTDKEYMIKGMRNWCDHPELMDEDMAAEFIDRNIFASVAGTNFYFWMQKDGSYSHSWVESSKLIARIRTSFLDNVIETKTMNSQGKIVNVSSTDIIADHACIVSEVVKIPQLESNGYIDNIWSPDAVLKLPMYRRNPKLVAEYSRDVEEWLIHFCGIHYDAIINWISQSLAFEDGPICALSITTAPGSGKKMLVEGLAECLEVPMLATGKDLVAKFNEPLSRTPFINVNEAWPKATSEYISEEFKKYTAGDKVFIEGKQKPIVQMSNPMRIIMTANNPFLVRDLIDKDPTSDDRQAIGERLLHFDLGISATEWLIEKGGNSFTGRKGNRWIADVQGNSEFIVAKHFLYLYERRLNKGVPNGRYLVMGNCAEESSILADHITTRDSSAKVITSILSIIETGKGNARYFLEEGTFRLYMTLGEISDDMTLSQVSTSHEQISNALMAITASQHPVERDYKMYHELDTNSLLMFAKKAGKDVPKLRAIIVAQEKHKKSIALGNQ